MPTRVTHKHAARRARNSDFEGHSFETFHACMPMQRGCKSASSQLVDRYVAAYSDPNPMNADGLKLIAAFVER